MTVATVEAASQTLRVTNPMTGELIGELPILGHVAVEAAVRRGRIAQPSWAALGARARGRLLRRWADAMWADREHLQALIRRETGKSDPSALLEVAALDNIATYYARTAARILRPRRRGTIFPLIQRGHIVYHPYGVVGFITPWNYPYFNALTDLLPALVAGNAVIIKPSEVTPYVAIHAVSMMHKVGFPPDIVQVVTGDGTTGQALVDLVDYISVTGSTATGRKIAVQAAERLIPYSLELGGKDPLIVLNDADLEAAVAGTLRSALENAGQACISIERVYVETGIYDRFVERVLESVKNYTVGSHSGFNVCMGCLTNMRELIRTEEHIRDAVEKGARVIFGGQRRPDLGPLFFEPTLLVDVDHTMKVMTEETFGPIVPIMRVSNADEAIRLANDSPYGLSASIYTRNLRRGAKLAERIEAGDVAINRPQMVIGTPDLPMGGFKQSGIGRRNGPEGLLRFVRSQSILADTLIGSKPALIFTDPITLEAFRLIRIVRKALPFF